MADLINVEILEDAKLFLDSLDEKSRKKVFFNIKKTKSGQRGEWFQKLKDTDDIWEFRTLYNEQHIRLLAFFRKQSSGQQSIIICTNGFIKKDNKTPIREIQRAETIKKQFQTGS